MNLYKEQQELMQDVDSYMKDLQLWKKRKLDQDNKFKELERRADEQQDDERIKQIESKYEEDEVENQMGRIMLNRRQFDIGQEMAL